MDGNICKKQNQQYLISVQNNEINKSTQISLATQII